MLTWKVIQKSQSGTNLDTIIEEKETAIWLYMVYQCWEMDQSSGNQFLFNWAIWQSQNDHKLNYKRQKSVWSGESIVKIRNKNIDLARKTSPDDYISVTNHISQTLMSQDPSFHY